MGEYKALDQDSSLVLFNKANVSSFNLNFAGDIWCQVLELHRERKLKRGYKQFPLDSKLPTSLNFCEDLELYVLIALFLREMAVKKSLH